MGGLLLTSRTAEQQVFFPENEACYMYSDIAELKNKIEYILANKTGGRPDSGARDKIS